MQDTKYRDFAAGLLPTLAKKNIIGVRVPQLRHYAKGLAKNEAAKQFMSDLPHRYLEENYLHAFLIEQIRDADACYQSLDAFLPYVDNWAVCDSLRPKALTADRERLLASIDQYLQSGHTYTVRFGIELLMLYFLDEYFSPDCLSRVAAVQSNEYYVNMMIAWYFATALAKQWDATVGYLENRRLPMWIHQKSIQKAVESYRITPEQKAYLRSLRSNVIT